MALDLYSINDVEIEKSGNMERDRIIFFANLNVVLYALCFWIQLGVLPYLTKSLGVDTTTFGYLQTTFAIVQLCGGPLFGRFGDLFGARNALLLAFLAAAFSYGFLFFATTVPILFLSRVPSLFMHSMQGAQMVVTDVSKGKDRASSIGRLGIAYGIGMVTGPFFGGLITEKFGVKAAACAACLGSVASILLVYFTIPKNTKEFAKSQDEDSVPVPQSSQSAGLFDYKRILGILKLQNVGYLLFIKCVSGVPIGILTAMFSVFVMEYFQMGAKENGYILSYSGAVSMVIQGFGIKLLTARYSEALLIKYSISSLILAYTIMIFTQQNIIIFLLALIPLASGGAVLQTIVTSVITKSVPSADTGSALGLSMATHSLIRSISPTIGGWLFASYGFYIFGLIGVFMNGLLCLYLVLYGKQEFVI